MGPECIDQKLRVPDRYSAVWERSAPDLTSKSSLQTTDFVLQVLGLLTQSPTLVLCWSHRLNGVADTLYFVGESAAHNREVWWQSAVVIDQ